MMPGKWPTSLALVGAGKMGTALLDGWLARGLPPGAVTAIDPQFDPAVRERYAALGCTCRTDAAQAAPAEVVMLAIKPQTLAGAAPGLAGLIGPGSLLISILAGKRIVNLRAALPRATAIIRTMPNTPAAVGRGITALAASAEVSADQRETATRLLAAVGEIVWLRDEAGIDAVTAVSGSGPAYVFLMVEALAAAGAEAGLEPDVALRLARATVEGAGELLFRSPDISAAKLRENVTSPGGTTAAALAELMHPASGLGPLIGRAVAAAKRRAGELSG
jgi:pyrroline-5-carboxylate reductase